MLEPDVEAVLAAFLRSSAFARTGAVITDLDGTAVIEHEGRIVVAPDVEYGLKRLAELGRPIAINTLRFPLNVVRTFGRAWSAITDAPLPLVSLNGAIMGVLRDNPAGSVLFEELDAVVLPHADIQEVMVGVRGLVDGGIDQLLLFHYPRDWTAGEIIWTPDASRVADIRGKFASASEVISGPVDALEAQLLARDHCMLFLHVEAPGERLMAYQHARPSSFITAAGVDKLDGARRLADRLGFDLAQSIGAGDTPMDSFLNGCGLAVLVGGMTLEHKGLAGTVRVPDPPALGAVLDRIAVLAGTPPEGSPAAEASP